MTDWFMTDAEVIVEGWWFRAHASLRKRRIERIDASLAARDEQRLLDAAVRWLMPSMADDQTHFRNRCNPAIETAADGESIMQTLADSRSDVLATDHAPDLLPEKSGPYAPATPVLPLVPLAMNDAPERVFDRPLMLERLVESVARTPVTVLDVEQRGCSRRGYFADLMRVDPHKAQTVPRENLLSRCIRSPFQGETLRPGIDPTLVNGHRGNNAGKLDRATRSMHVGFSR
ncbi:MAG: hypothetical protein ABI650_12555 [Dokdonella sp.]